MSKFFDLNGTSIPFRNGQGRPFRNGQGRPFKTASVDRYNGQPGQMLRGCFGVLSMSYLYVCTKNWLVGAS